MLFQRSLKTFISSLTTSLRHKNTCMTTNTDSTEFASLELADRVITCMDHNEAPIHNYLDLSKAFDTLLLNYGITAYVVDHYN